MTLISTIDLKIVTYAEARNAIQAVRRTVFQVEQGVDPSIEADGLDDGAIHILAYCGDVPIGTARIRYLSTELAKIERVAVLATYRGRGVGTQIMKKAIAFLKGKNISVIKINAQVHARTFYKKLGFQQQGDEFDEAGIPHVEMRIENLFHFFKK